MTQAENGTGNEPASPRKMRPLTRALVVLLLLTVILAILYVGFSPLL